MSFPSRQQLRFVVKPLWFLGCLAPFLWLVANAFGVAGSGLGADPIEAVQDAMGIWALRILLLTLSLTPLRWLVGRSWPVQLRRMTGLFALFYAALHFLNYVWLDQGIDWPAISEDILKRPFITIGLLALLGLIALGLTSTRGWQRRLGKRWFTLHKLIYPAAILVCWHFWWQVKEDITEPLIYALILTVLLLARLLHKYKRGARAPR